ncbi:hypothetical protein QTP88_027884 [Uroleucon formosanum]
MFGVWKGEMKKNVKLGLLSRVSVADMIMLSYILDVFTTSRPSTNINNLGVKSVVAIFSQVPDQSFSSFECSTSTNDSKETEDNNHSIFDITAYIGKHMSNNEKLEALKTIWTPDNNHNFPITLHGNKNLKLQLSWLNKWNWIVYSSLVDGVYCKYCVLYGIKKGRKGGQLLGQLCNQPFKNWKHATKKFKLHERKISSVHDKLNIASKKQKEDNRKIILPVIKFVILCGRQGISIRGHQDYGSLELNKPTENDGYFRAILRFYINATGISGDNSSKNCKKNDQYISWKIQNQIVDACYTAVSKKIFNKINVCKYFSIIADETAKIYEMNIDKFISENSLKLFTRFGIDTIFLQYDSKSWDNHISLVNGKELIKSLKIVNDTAERGVKLMADFNEALIVNED